MKTGNHKTIYVSVILLSTVMMINSSCSSTRAEPALTNLDKTSSTNENVINKKDVEFLVSATDINILEIALGKLAQEKGNSSHVKDLGKMMQEQHEKTLKKITELAKSKKIVIPTTLTDKGMEKYDQLNNLSGSKFDQTYADKMVKGHENAIKLFEEAATNSIDQDIKDWAYSALPQLKSHLRHAEECQKKCNTK